jgi:proteic killer suppression protein
MSGVIKSFRSKPLRDFFLADKVRGIRPDLIERCRACLSVLDAATSLTDMALPGLGFHRLQGKPVRYALAVNGPWRITFEWAEGDAIRVDLEQYH